MRVLFIETQVVVIFLTIPLKHKTPVYHTVKWIEWFVFPSQTSLWPQQRFYFNTNFVTVNVATSQLCRFSMETWGVLSVGGTPIYQGG